MSVYVSVDSFIYVEKKKYILSYIFLFPTLLFIPYYTVVHPISLPNIFIREGR